MSNKIPPQFQVFKNKKLTYEDVEELLITCLLTRKTWNHQTLWYSTSKTWNTFKDDLSHNQQIVLRYVIIKLRRAFCELAFQNNWRWMENEILIKELKNQLVPKIKSTYYRNTIVKKFTNHLPSPN